MACGRLRDRRESRRPQGRSGFHCQLHLWRGVAQVSLAYVNAITAQQMEQLTQGRSELASTLKNLYWAQLAIESFNRG